MDIRPARAGDLDTLVAFTSDTFEWGDYVPRMLPEWLASTEGVIMVAVDDDDVPIAMARAVFLTDTEVWSHAARVHPDHRGRGIAGTLADHLMAWSRDHGGQIVRLLIEDDNLPSITHITKVGFTRAVSVIRATRTVGAGSPNPDGNGGRRNPSSLDARPGKRQDLVLVRSVWSTSEAGRLLRGLIGGHWRFHRLRDADIEAAAATGNLWEVGSSWAISDRDDERFDIRLLATEPTEAYDVIKALVDTANNRGAESMELWLADTDWMVQAARRCGFEVSGMGVWEHPL
jgi:GNAT superfamily N-acetyltransferase